MNNKKELKSNHSRLMQRLVWLLILTLGIISFGCQCDCEEATDEYYVKYELWVDDGLHRVIVDITVKDENNNDESFTFDAYPQLWETIIGPVQKGFKATINASIKDDILILLQPKIYVSKNDSPFALKANDNSTTGRKSVQLSYTID